MSTFWEKPGNTVLPALGAFSGAIGVVAGALGAHFLSASLEASGHLEAWKTAVFYNLVHAVAIVSTVTRSHGNQSAAWLWLIGLTMFSGSIYWLALGGPRWVGPVTPLGGLFLIAGWISFAVVALKQPIGGDS